MKICQFNPTAGFIVGGGEIYPFMQSKFLAEMGHEITMVVFRTKKETDYFISFKKNNPNIKFVYLALPEKTFSVSPETFNHESAHLLYFLLARQFNEFCRLTAPQVVISHYAPGPILTPANVKSLLFLHGVPGIYLPANKAGVSLADKVVAVSHSVVEGWHKLYGTPQNLQVIYNAVDSSSFTPNKKAKEDIDLLCFGRLIEIKGIQDLIASVHKLKTEHGQLLKLFIAGQGPFEGDLRKQVDALGLRENVKFLGYVEEKDKLNLYNRAKICVFPSFDKEGVLTTVLEAGAMEKPVITSNCCGMTEFIKDGSNGLLFKPRDVADLSSKILMLFGDLSLRQTLGRQARLDVVAKWSWQKHAEIVESVLLKLIE